MKLPHPRSTRRAVLGAAGLGLALPFLGGSAAASVGRRKLVILICRGGLDGLAAVPPVGDPAYAALRGAVALTPDTALALDSTFALHPALSFCHALAGRGQLRVAPAVATPDRSRSHFQGQDVLESGGSVLYASEVGWLNRALSALGAAAPGAVSVGRQGPLILRGPVRTGSWSPGVGGDAAGPVATLLQDLYRRDPLLGSALASGIETELRVRLAQEAAGLQPARAETPADTGACERAPVRSKQAGETGATLGRLMAQEGGPSIAAMSLDGFDTHAGQGAATGPLATRLRHLDATVEGLHAGLGAGWADTLVLVVTEFGRTARVNGTGGTDHGTAFAALVLGGAVKPGGLIGDWPTLASGRLHEGRDLAPTLDVRTLFKTALRDHFGLERSSLDTLVFPGSAAAAPLQAALA